MLVFKNFYCFKKFCELQLQRNVFGISAHSPNCKSIHDCDHGSQINTVLPRAWRPANQQIVAETTKHFNFLGCIVFCRKYKHTHLSIPILFRNFELLQSILNSKAFISFCFKHNASSFRFAIRTEFHDEIANFTLGYRSKRCTSRSENITRRIQILGKKFSHCCFEINTLLWRLVNFFFPDFVFFHKLPNAIQTLIQTFHHSA
mmetsp:Transcript_2572/g.4529  ORF Transcript_2572/g.4529 Transcript_2572/m.4529 type:complete len:203 (+) Transcript_2572:598-1206(+)